MNTATASPAPDDNPPRSPRQQVDDVLLQVKHRLSMQGNRLTVATLLFTVLLERDPVEVVQVLTSFGISSSDFRDDISKAIDALDDLPDSKPVEKMMAILSDAEAYARANGYSFVTCDVLLIATTEHLYEPLSLLARRYISRDDLIAQLDPHRNLSIPPSMWPADSYADSVKVEKKTLHVDTEITLHNSATASLAWAGIEARYENRRSVTDADLLIGVLRNEKSRAAQALAHLGVDVASIRESLAEMDKTDDVIAEIVAPYGGMEQFEAAKGLRAYRDDASHDPARLRKLTGWALWAISQAHVAAAMEGETSTAARHLLLGLLKIGSGPTAFFLDSVGLDYDLVRRTFDDMRETMPDVCDTEGGD